MINDDYLFCFLDKFAVLVCVLCTVSNIIAKDIRTAGMVDALTSLLKAGVEAGNGIMNIDMEDDLNANRDPAKQILDAVGPALGPYGTILSAFGSLLLLFKEQEPTDREFIAQQFQDIHLRSNAIHSELERIKHLIGEIPEKVELHARTTRIEILLLAFQRLQQSRLTELSDFRSKCENNPPDETLDYIYINHEAIMFSVAQNYDRDAVLRTMQSLGIIQLTALKLYEICHATKSVDLHAERRDQYVNDKTRIVEEFKRNIKTVMQVFYDAGNHIMSNFFDEYARNEIDAFVKEHTNLNVAELSAKLYDMLATKYYWRQFMIVVHDSIAKSTEEAYHIKYPAHVHSWVNGGRIWFVIASGYLLSPTEEDNFKSGIYGCIDQLQQNPYVEFMMEEWGCKILDYNFNYIELLGPDAHIRNLHDCVIAYGLAHMFCVKDEYNLYVYGADDATVVHKNITRINGLIGGGTLGIVAVNY